MIHQNEDSRIRFRTRGRSVAGALLAWLVLATGCHTTGAQSAAAAPGQQSVQAAYDPAKAFLKLDEIDPQPVVVGEPIVAERPLSRRAERRIEKANRLYRQQRYTEAGLELERALQSDPDAFEVHLALGRVLRAAGSIERSRTHLRKAADLRPRDATTHYLLALAAVEDGDAQAAVAEVRVAQTCTPNGGEDVRALALYRLADLLREDGYLTAALRLYRSYEEAAAKLATQGEVEHELSTLLKVSGGLAASQMSLIHESLGDFGMAADELVRGLAGETPDVAAGRRLVDLYGQAGRHEESLAEARRLAALDPVAVSTLLLAHRRAGHPQHAADDVARLVADSPQPGRYVSAYVALLVEMDRRADAEEWLRGYCQDHPTDLDARWRLFDLCVESSEWAAALDVAVNAVRADNSAAPQARAKMIDLPAEAATRLLAPAVDRPVGQLDYASAYLLGCLAARHDEFEQARILLTRALEAEPAAPAVKIELATILLRQYRWTEALSHLAELTDAEPRDARVERLLGQANAGLDRNEQAIVHLRAAISLNRADVRALRALGELYERIEQPLQAIRQYRAVLEINPLDEQAREALFGLYWSEGQRDRAVSQVDALRKTAASPNRIARCVARMELQGPGSGYEGFRATLTEALERGGPDGRSLTFVGMSYLGEGDYHQALAVLHQALAADADDVDTLTALAEAYRLTLQFEASVEVLRRLLGRHPNRDSWALALIDALITNLDFDGAIEQARGHLARAGLSEAARWQYRTALIDALVIARRHDEAIETIKRWLSDSPGDASARRMLIQVCQEAEVYGQALPLVRSWFEEDPANIALTVWYSTLLLADNRADQANRVLLDLLEEDPDNDELQLLLIGTLTDQGRYDDAIELAINCVADTRVPLAYQQRMLQVYDEAGRFQEAIELIGELMHQNSADTRGGSIETDELRRILALSLLRAKQYQRAQALLTRWIEDADDPGRTFGWLTLLSGVQLERGQRAEATETLEQAYALRPLDAGVNNDLAYNWVDVGVRLVEAERMLRYAVARSPRNHAYLDSLGWALYKRGDFAGAIEWLTRARAFDREGDAVIADHLGDACWRAGRGQQAAENWRLAAKFASERLADPDLPPRPEDQQVLDAATEKLARFEAGETPEVAPVVILQDSSAGNESETQEAAQATSSPEA